jgi:membrane-associated HD superfamily phosphohydrolase
MYPFGPKPQTREAWVVSIADKAASLTDLTVMLGGLVTGRTFIRRRQFRQSDPHLRMRLQRRGRRLRAS